MAAKKKTTRKKLEIDSKKLLDMVNAGIPQKEIMDKLGVKNSNQLKVAYYNALMETGKIKPIKSGRTSGYAKPSKEIAVGKRGSLIIPKDLVADLGYKEGDTFQVKRSKAGITLSKK